MILTHFCLGSVRLPCGFQEFLEPQYVQKGPKWPRDEPTMLFQMGFLQQVKCWQSVFLVTKMHFASLCHALFYFCSAGVGGCLSSVRFWRLPACVQCHFTANRTVLWCSAQCIRGLAMVRLASAAGANTQTRSYLKIAFILLSFYPSHISGFGGGGNFRLLCARVAPATVADPVSPLRSPPTRW